MIRTCLLFGVLLVGCTGQITDTAPTGQPASGPSDSSSGPGSSTTDAGVGGGASGTTTTTTTGGTTTQTTGAGGVGGGSATETIEVPRVARLTHYQWANSVQDLLL